MAGVPSNSWSVGAVITVSVGPSRRPDRPVGGRRWHSLPSDRKSGRKALEALVRLTGPRATRIRDCYQFLPNTSAQSPIEHVSHPPTARHRLTTRLTGYCSFINIYIK